LATEAFDEANMDVASVADLKRSLSHAHPPPGLSPALTCLWYAGKTQFQTNELDDIYKKAGSPFNGGGHLADAVGLDYEVPAGSPAFYWLTAHTISQTIEYGFRVSKTRDPDDPSTWGDPSLNWVHGFLHRLESDDRNAAGWYQRGLQSPSTDPLPDEWATIAGALLTAPRLGYSAPMDQLAPSAQALLTRADPFPLRIAPDALTYVVDPTLTRITADEAAGRPVVNVEYGVALVGALLLTQHDWDAAHQLLLGRGSAMHAAVPKTSAAACTLAYLHAILHRIEGPADNEGNTPGFRNAEYWHAQAGYHPVFPLLARIAEVELGPGGGGCLAADGTWDPSEFTRLVERVTSGEADRGLVESCSRMQEAEMAALIGHCLAAACDSAAAARL
jgi:hypothetical protein